jgi:hypothetical protein
MKDGAYTLLSRALSIVLIKILKILGVNKNEQTQKCRKIFKTCH